MVKITILDFGGQYAHLIARRIRELGVYSEIADPETWTPAKTPDCAGVILSGGPDSVTSHPRGRIPWLLQVPFPVLGICFGHQLLAYELNGKVSRSREKEFGRTPLKLLNNSPIFSGLPDGFQVWMSHGDSVEMLPEGFDLLASTDQVPIAAFASRDQRIFGLQFHPEVTHTEHGQLILDRFVSRCTPKRDWKIANMRARLVSEIQKTVGNRKILLLVSGGVDSLVALELCSKAVSKSQIYAIHVDTGFMRENESQDVMSYLRTRGYPHLELVEAEARFLKELDHVIDPEQKRKIIGRLFVKVIQDQLKKLDLNEDWLLVQGTIYPDTIESGGTKNAAVIKTHHNRVPEIDDLIRKGRVLEPLKEFYKDEVRRLGLELGISETLILRQPFPGPGLAIRVLGYDQKAAANSTSQLAPKLTDERKLKEMLLSQGLYGKMLNIRSVGVQGDERTYRQPALIWSEGQAVSWETLKNLAAKIPNEIHSINRVLISLRPIKAEHQLKDTFLNREVLDHLRQVDTLVRAELSGFQDIWQVPVVALPYYCPDGKQCFVMRPVVSIDAMTADAFELPFDVWEKILMKFEKLEQGGALWLDLTSKPPGTIEWE